ncbi:MAG: cysteine desulfurase family protein, partial [Nitrososphaerales archaeon]
IAHDGGSFFHTDAVQAAGKIPIDVEDLDVDLLTLSGHKFAGPKGVGILYVKKDIELEPLVHGGEQEKGLRSGTENVPGIVGMGVAAELAASTLREMDNVRLLRDKLETGIKRLVPDAKLNGHKGKRLPNTLNMTLPNLRGESLVLAMDQKGIALSSGSACKSGSPDPSHALLAMGMTNADAHCAIRISLSKKTRSKEVDRTLKAFGEILDEMEATVRFLPCK